MAMENFTSSLTCAVSSVSSKLKDSVSVLTDLKEAGWEKVSTLVNDILGLAPLVEVAGFNMKDVVVEAGIPPGIVLQFVKEKEVAPETIENLLEQNKDKEVLCVIVRGLQKADALQKGLKLSHYVFTGLNMKIGLPPDVSLKFSRTDKGQ